MILRIAEFIYRHRMSPYLQDKSTLIQDKKGHKSGMGTVTKVIRKNKANKKHISNSAYLHRNSYIANSAYLHRNSYTITNAKYITSVLFQHALHEILMCEMVIHI